MIHYHFDEMARRRLWLNLQDLTVHEGNFVEMVTEAAHKAAKKYGGLVRPAYDAVSTRNPIMDHFFFCRDEMLPPFIEACFQSFHYVGVNDRSGVLDAGGRAKGVEEINAVLREHQIGYQFSPFIERETGKKGFRGGRKVETEYPRVLVMDNEYTFKEAVKPALELLHDARFKTANGEFMKAHEDCREGDLEHAMTGCGSAFESVLKTVCHIKGWTSDPQYNPKAALAQMVQFCIGKKLFPSFYENSFVGVATIRNALSSAHGRGGAAPPPVVTRDQVDHLLSLTAAHMLLVISLAKI